MKEVELTPNQEREVLEMLAELECLTLEQRALVISSLLGMVIAAAEQTVGVRGEAVQWAIGFLHHQIARARGLISPEGRLVQ